MDFFSDFLIIFEVAFFNVKIEERVKNIVKTVKNWRPGRVSRSKNGHVFDLVNLLKFKMWNLLWEASESKNCPKRAYFS